MLQVGFFTVFALLLARVMRAPRGTWRWIIAAAVVVLLASQLMPAGNAFRESVRDSAPGALVLGALAVPVVAYGFGIRHLRRRTGIAQPAQPPAQRPSGLVLVVDDAAFARDTARALAAEEGAETVSVGWRDHAGGMTGHARLRICGALADLALLWVAPEARGRGIGSRLLAQAEVEARERGADRLAATAGDAGAAAFLARHGFEIYGRLHDAGRSHLVKVLA